MSNRRADWPRVRWLIGAATVVLMLAIVWALLVPVADWLARHDIGSAKGSLATARDAAPGRLLTLGAGLLAAGALLFTARNFTLSREGQVTDRYTKAIEQLGSDKLDVRIGGIYALERVARDSAKDHPTVMEVLTAFIREHSREPWPVDGKGAQQGEKKTRPDVQAAVTAVGRRDVKRDILLLDLSGADLTGARLTRADLTRADLTRADLTGAHLTAAHLAFAGLHKAHLNDADLGGADLTCADLTRAELTHADLGGAHLNGAHLNEAYLTGVHLDGADLHDAHLNDAHLIGAHLGGAHLGGADLTRADLTNADLTGAHLMAADLTSALLGGALLGGANLTGVGWRDGVAVPKGWEVIADTRYLKRVDELSEVMTHYFR